MNKLLIDYINEVLEDCQIFGAKHSCVFYVNAVEPHNFVDYEVKPDNVKYFDERSVKTNLFTLLCHLIAISLDELEIYSAKTCLVTALRNLSNLSQKDFAIKAQIQIDTLQNWESGRSEPTIDKIIALAKLCDIDSATLLNTYNFLETSK